MDRRVCVGENKNETTIYRFFEIIDRQLDLKDDEKAIL